MQSSHISEKCKIMLRSFRTHGLAALILILSGLISSLLADSEPISGVIQQVTPIGDIVVLQDGNASAVTVRLWGLKFIDIKSADKFLKKRKISCDVVHRRDDRPAVFCFVSPMLLGSKPRNLWISLFDWLPELNIALFYCSSGDLEGTSQSTNGSKWLCRGQKSPYYGPTEIQ